MQERRGDARAVLLAAAAAAGLFLAWQLSEVFILAFGAVVMAAVFRALALPISRRTPLPEGWAVLLVVLVLVAGVLASGWLFGNQLIGEARALIESLPEAIEDLREQLEATGMGRNLLDALQDMIEDAPGALGNLRQIATGALGAATTLALIFFLSVYLAINPSLYIRGVVNLFPKAGRQRVLDAIAEAGGDLRSWLVGQAIAMVSVGLLTGLGLWLLDIPYAFALAVVAGIFEFVPIIGPIAAAVPAVLLGFGMGGTTGLWVLGLYIAVQQLESNLIMPVAQRWAVALAPGVGLLAVVAFGLLFGILGVLFATPLAVVAVAMVRKMWVEDTLGGPLEKD
ncbi:AI-2E family transporter [Telmatospirillum sp. J64-1]|uniref:AI-2E family transporter n=1 Tax=Telmatospirillum sp. J64-1 TaxID=2502183 RepID=UPI00163DC653|nr:AI-2E family transporter [Telmatospirillum sp. J64-1]